MFDLSFVKQLLDCFIPEKEVRIGIFKTTCQKVHNFKIITFSIKCYFEVKN